jgi:hypothetical protein
MMMMMMMKNASGGKRSFETARHRWENNIKMDLKGIWCKSVDYVHLSQQCNNES